MPEVPAGCGLCAERMCILLRWWRKQHEQKRLLDAMYNVFQMHDSLGNLAPLDAAFSFERPYPFFFFYSIMSVKMNTHLQYLAHVSEMLPQRPQFKSS